MKRLLLTVIGRAKQRLRTALDRRRYARWIRDVEPRQVAHLDARLPPLAACTRRPRISILVPLFNTPEAYLRAAIESVQAQTYPEWELCLADDASPDPVALALARRYAETDDRIKVCARTERGHISACTNSALALATGEYVALLDHDDALHPRALERVVQTLNRHPDADLIYTDEDKVTVRGTRYEPIFKPDWNYWLFLAYNLVNHLGVYRKAVIDRIGGFRTGFEGSQDYDLVLRFIEEAGEQHIHHIPEVLYHWRAVPASTAGDPSTKRYAFDAAKRAIREHLERRGLQAEVGDAYLYILHKVNLAFDATVRTVSIVLVAEDVAQAERALNHVIDQTDYPGLEIVLGAPGLVASAGREGDVAVTRLDTRGQMRADAYTRAADAAGGTHVVFLNPALRIRNRTWLTEMMSPAADPSVGIVGGKLYGPGGRIRNAGLILGVGPELYDYAWRGYSGTTFGIAGRARVIQELSAVSADCMLTDRALFRELGGFNSEPVRSHYYDVDYCLRALRAGRKTVWTPFAEFTDSRRRGVPAQAEAAAERDAMRDAWGDRVRHDPCYNWNYSSRNARFEW